MGERSKLDELDLIRRCIGREDGAWAEMVEAYSALVYFSIGRTLKAHGAPRADEVMNELHNAFFLSLLEDDFRRLRCFQGRSKLSHWIKVVASNRTVDHLRRRRHHVWLDALSPVEMASRALLIDSAPSPEEAAMKAQRLRQMNKVLAKLPAADQLMVRLIYVEGVPGETVARVLGTTVGAVYTRKNRLRKRLVALFAAAGLSG